MGEQEVDRDPGFNETVDRYSAQRHEARRIIRSFLVTKGSLLGVPARAEHLAVPASLERYEPDDGEGNDRDTCKDTKADRLQLRNRSMMWSVCRHAGSRQLACTDKDLQLGSRHGRRSGSGG